MSDKNSTTLTKQLEARVGKVLSHHQNRGGFSTALSYIPDDAAEQAHGGLYFVIDIGSPSPLSADIAYNLIDMVKDEYYSDLTLPASKSFENALKAANEELAAIYKSGEKDWVGKFNAIIAAVAGRDIFIVQRGTAEIHLLRAGQMTNLSRGMYTPGETYRPEETLVNLLEGEIELADKVLLSTSELFYYISIEKLKRLVEGNSPAAAAKKLATLLEQEETINRTSVLVSEFNLPELIEHEPEAVPAENWVGEPAAERPARKQVVNEEPAIDKTQSITDAMEAVQSPKVEEPQMHNYQSEAVEDEEYSQVQHTSLPQIDLEAGVNMARAGFDTIRKNINFGDYKTKLHLDNDTVKGATNIAGKIFSAIGIVLSEAYKFSAKFVGKAVRDIRRRPNGNKILMGIGIGLVVAVVGIGALATSAYSSRSGSKSANESYKVATQKRDEAQAALIYEDTAKAKVLLAEAYLAAQAAAANPRLQSQAQSLMVDLQKQLDTVNGVKRFLDVQPTADFATLNSQLGDQKQATVGQAILFGDGLYAVDSENNKIYRYRPGSGEMAIVNSLASVDRKLRLVSPFSEEELVFYTNPANLYGLNLANNSLAGKALDTGSWANADSIIGYTNKLYFLDQANNQIWKYQTAPEGFTPIAPYFENGSGVDIAGALDFAINGDVLVLMPDNELKKFTGGAATDFKLQDIPQPYAKLGHITQMFADTGTQIYLIDEQNKRLLAFDNNGNYVAQYIYGDSIQNVSNLHVDEAAGFAYLTAGTKVYRLPIK